MKTMKVKKVNKFRLEKPVKHETTWYSQEIRDDMFRELDDITDQLFSSRQELIDRFAEIQRVAM